MKPIIYSAESVTPLSPTHTLASTKAEPHDGHRRCLSISALCFAVAAGLLLTACGKDEETQPPTPGPDGAPPVVEVKPVNPEAPADVQQQTRIAQAVAIRDGATPPPPAMQLRGGELATPEVLAAYNQYLLQEVFKQKDAPETLQELVTKWRQLPRLPTPPPGKRIVYDAANHIIRLDPP